MRRAFPNARVTRWSSEVDSGKTLYEAESREGAIRRDITIGADGALISVETVMTMAQLPEAVRSAAARYRARIELIELVAEGRDTTYEFHLVRPVEELKLRSNGQRATN